MGDGGGEAGSQLLVGGQLRWRLEKEDEEVGVSCRLLLGEPTARRGTAESARRGPARRDYSALAVEHDHGLVAVRHERQDALLVHHFFTIRLPFANWAAADNGRKHAQGSNRRGRRGDRAGDGAAPRRRRL